MPRSPSDSVEGRPVVRTIGHGTRTSDELASLLSAAGVVTLIDVRRYPTGRRQPHLSQERLAADLPERGVAYEWWGEALGGRRSAMGSAVAASGWRSPAFAAYSAHMSAPEFRGALAELEERASAGEALAIMCAETVWWRCHRRLIADALTLDGFTVEHLIDRVPGRPIGCPNRPGNSEDSIRMVSGRIAETGEPRGPSPASPASPASARTPGYACGPPNCSWARSRACPTRWQDRVGLGRSALRAGTSGALFAP